MLKHKCLPLVAPLDQEDLHRFTDLISDKNWIIPVTVLLQVIPVTVAAHGFWKTRQLKTQLRIEREHTKQMQIDRFRPGYHAGQPQSLADHPHHGLLHH